MQSCPSALYSWSMNNLFHHLSSASVTHLNFCMQVAFVCSTCIPSAVLACVCSTVAFHLHELPFICSKLPFTSRAKMGPLVCVALSMGQSHRSTDICLHPVWGKLPGRPSQSSRPAACHSMIILPDLACCCSHCLGLLLNLGHNLGGILLLLPFLAFLLISEMTLKHMYNFSLPLNLIYDVLQAFLVCLMHICS